MAVLPNFSTNINTMKKITSAVVMLLLLVTAHSQSAIALTKKSFTGYTGGPAEIVADSILTIVNAVYNSKGFKDSLTALTFKHRGNNCHCNNDIVMTGDIIKGSDVYAHLFKVLTPKIDIVIKKHSPSGLGITPICTNHITSFKNNVASDMPELPLSAALAVNVCHEYFHSLGYCHTYTSLRERDTRPDGTHVNWEIYNRDVTYRIGWIVYDILNRWINKEHKQYPYHI